MRWKPNVTVAAVIEVDDRFLMIEEQAEAGVVINQPAGHLEKDESLLDAVKREVLEETAWEFEPESIVGIYLYPSSHNDITYLRVCFTGRCLQHHPEQALDEGIIATHWMTLEELSQRTETLRSPLVSQCIEDYRAGKRYSLDILGQY